MLPQMQESGAPMAELARLSRTTRSAPTRARRAGPRQRYMAFLSYSHRDEEIAGWLHDSLEEFRVPPKLVGRLTNMGPVPKRLTPVFRDRHELAAAGDLSDEIEEAIAGSRFLIVLCSPAAATSRWIDKEIACFKKLHGEEQVLAAIIAGEPFASDTKGREAEECFPKALRTHYDGRGRPTAQRAEPLAADLRDAGDGRRMGLLKIVAGMLGVGLDDLAQREAHRRHRRHTLFTAASIAGMLAASALAYSAIQARDEARDQRREAEGLVGFMLGDLREKLKPIGRLDVLDSVAARALKYYESQDKEDLGDAALAQRSEALTLMGEMANTRGDLDGALARYREAMEGTAEAVRRAPDNPQNLFGHAQNVFWVGYIDYQRGNMDKAAAAFREYRRLADRMIALAPDKPDYRLERIYADSTLGTVLMDQRHYEAAATIYQQSLEPTEALIAKEPANLSYQMKLTETLAWLADSREGTGQLDEALAHRQRQLAHLARLWQTHKGDAQIKRAEMTTRRSIARLFAARGQMREALDEAKGASAVSAWLTKTEPSNTEWTQAGAHAEFDRAAIALAANRIEDARVAARSGCDAAARLVARDPSVSAWRTSLRLNCLKTSGLIALRGGEADQAVSLARQAVAIARTEKRSTVQAIALARSEMILAESLAKSGQGEAARTAYQRALAAWPTSISEQPAELADHVILLRRLGRTDDAQPMIGRLRAMGYRQPDYVRAVQQPG